MTRLLYEELRPRNEDAWPFGICAILDNIFDSLEGERLSAKTLFQRIQDLETIKIENGKSYV